MATTDYPVGSPLAVKHWQKDLMKEALKKTYALQFIGSGKDVLCTIKSETQRNAGDRVRVGIRSQLSGAGIKGDDTLEGNEESLETFYQDVVIEQLRHAVRSKGKMSEQRVPFSVRAEARDGLADWWADRFDTWFFSQLCGNTAQTDDRFYGFNAPVAPDADHVTYHTSGSTAEVSLSATSVAKMNLTVIDVAVEKAQVAKNAIRPIRINGADHYVMFIHPFQKTDLRINTATGQWQDIQKAALSGGNASSNPIFTGALGMYNNVILHESIRVPASPTNASARRAVLCGAQALAMAFGREFGKGTYSWVEELFDFKNQLGVAAGCQAGLIKTRFNGSDYGTVVVPTYAVAH
jgi:N4-gp56 family major capsid protein